jgi:hypothetical protein
VAKTFKIPFKKLSIYRTPTTINDKNPNVTPLKEQIKQNKHNNINEKEIMIMNPFPLR